jgi:hypothetical protein
LDLKSLILFFARRNPVFGGFHFFEKEQIRSAHPIVYKWYKPQTLDKSLHSLPLIRRYTGSTRAVYDYARKEKIVMMGKASRFLLFFYVLSIFQFAVPVLSDMAAHTFWEQKHILTVHEVSGRFHMHQELANNIHQSDKQQSQENKSEIVQYIAAQPLTTDAPRYTTFISIYRIYSFFHPDLRQDIDSPPPQA